MSVSDTAVAVAAVRRHATPLVRDAVRADYPAIRHVIIGGSAASPTLQHSLQERHGITVRHAWGMTEMSPLGTVAVPPDCLAKP